MLAGKSEYVQGLTVEECATLLNIDVADTDLMELVYDTAFAIKNRIYGNRIVLFAPLYIANYCVNSCTYCAFRAGNKSLQVRRGNRQQRHATATDSHASPGLDGHRSCMLTCPRHAATAHGPD